MRAAFPRRDKQPEEKIAAHFSTENLNPFSSKGRLAFSTFGLSVVAIVIFNVVVWAVMRSQLISARAALDEARTLILYAIWIVFAIAGFAAATNTFIKRWAHILGDRNLPRFWKTLIRFSLLSPLLAYPLTLITFFFVPKGPCLDVDDGGSRSASLSLLAGGLILAIIASAFLPASILGIERLDFRTSMQPIDAAQPGPFRFPRPEVLKPIIAAASPGLRYLFWMGADAYRARQLSRAVQETESPLCRERMGFLGLEVQDCYFSSLRKMATVAPLVSPYFALYFESTYRQGMAAKFKTEVDASVVDGTIRKGFTFSLLMLSNQLELIEPGPMFLDRVDLLRPAALLHAYGSPEFPFVEAGQDIQRVGLLRKLIPILEFQLNGVQKFLSEQGRALGAEEVTINAEVQDIRRRIDAVKRDPLRAR